jgi:O-acetyl-ADP-ribose deacetylase (regulator of RNase III)
MIELRTGNLLTAEADAFVNTVNTQGAMGKGLALQFRRAFPENARRYAAAARRGEIEIGRMFVVHEPTLQGEKLVINFPTKERWRRPSRLEYIERGLEDLREVLVTCGIDVVAIPPLGCGLGGLDWEDVQPRIVNALADIPARILLYEPAGAPEAAAMPVRTRRPRMTASRAALIGVLGRYLGMGDDASPLVVQKLLYFLHEAGEPLDLHFAAKQYGPYDDDVRHLLTDLEGHFVTGVGDGTGKEPILLIEGAETEAREHLDQHPETDQRFDRIVDLIKGFESPYSLELLATTHWVAAKEGAETPEEAIRKVRSWSQRKAQIFRPDDVTIAWDHLAELGWLGQHAAA